MSERESSVGEEQVLTQNTVAMPSPGAMLRMAREAQGLHIDTLAVAMKIPVKKLEALETDRYDLLPDTVFARALASSICRTLKIDPTPVLERLPSNIAPQLKIAESGINTPFRGATEGVGGAYFEHLSKPIVLAVMALLVGVLVITFFPAGSLTEVFGEIKSEDNSVTSVDSQAQTSEIRPDQVGDAVPTLNSSLTISNPPESVPVAPGVVDTANLAAATQLAAEKAPEAAVVADLISFKVNGTSWIEVVDAKGVIQLSTTLRDGEVASANGAVPLAVIVGRADSTEVRLRGKPFDLSVVAKNNVARFEVK